MAQGQFSGKAWREQVITRQPAAEKRFTVAWPMPRLAPVSSITRRVLGVWDGKNRSCRGGEIAPDATPIPDGGPCGAGGRAVAAWSLPAERHRRALPSPLPGAAAAQVWTADDGGLRKKPRPRPAVALA